ncbi:MAG: hypothetical protein QF682_11115, partial [Candidatus Thermoplasmatota archaeon]|nr:hypothetical protein [Candidatus Thermoplasmatota archaeon]
SIDNDIDVWDAETGKVFVTFLVTVSDLKCVSWSMDNRMVVSGHADGKARIWSSDIDSDGYIMDDFPLDPAAAIDTDGDGFPDMWNEG